MVSVTVSKIGEDMNDVKEPHISYGQENAAELQTFVDAIQKAKKVNGIVDIVKPDFLLKY
ncbi:hypothetical protein BV455_00252 [Parageobacillus caldoxylosilyticus]|uniref:hypothetical protein n=1 Tax=Saccharococcus caldoxylosilyticus TaxID=81408 RepID=UPI001C4DE440|nr:hypothetical protein [Parageobacillus caldoxylosilyticus]QXJ36990.1 hypothetical protein BV455_00252 [Parageobacillus caldoxylosilyticus]